MKTKTYSVSEARNHWAEILAAVEQGEEVAITKYGDTVASITPARKPKKRPAPPPGFMLAEGWKIEIADDFDSIPNDPSIALNLGVHLVGEDETCAEGLMHLRRAEKLGHRRARRIIDEVERRLHPEKLDSA